MKILVTGASGQLGQRVIPHLADKVGAESIIALVRSDAAAETYTAQNIETRRGDYNDVAALTQAFAGGDRLLLISGSEVGQRVAQHKNVVQAAQNAGVNHIHYTSILRADENPMALAAEHKATEDVIRASSLTWTLLRNGWYTENLLGSVETAEQTGHVYGTSGDGLYAAATRDDYALAAATVLATDGHAGKTYELAGDTSFTLADFAAAIGKAKGKEVTYVDMPQDAYASALVEAGLPQPFAEILADSGARAGEGWLNDDSQTLSALTGRATTPVGALL